MLGVFAGRLYFPAVLVVRSVATAYRIQEPTPYRLALRVGYRDCVAGVGMMDVALRHV
jgi:hypothetical protein